MNCVVKAHYFYTFFIQSLLFSLDVAAFFSLSFPFVHFSLLLLARYCPHALALTLSFHIVSLKLCLTPSCFHSYIRQSLAKCFHYDLFCSNLVVVVVFFPFFAFALYSLLHQFLWKKKSPFQPQTQSKVRQFSSNKKKRRVS